MMEILFDPMFDVYTCFRSFDTRIMCVPLCPVSKRQSILSVAGSYRAIVLFVSAVKYNLPPANASPWGRASGLTSMRRSSFRAARSIIEMVWPGAGPVP